MADGTVVVGSNDGTCYGVDAVAGDEVWTHDTGGPIRGCPAIAGGTAYVTGADGTAYAIDAGLGDTVWTNSIVDDGTRTPALSDRAAFVGNRSGTTLKLDLEDGGADWTHTSDAGGVSPSPTVFEDYVYTGTPQGDDTLYKLSHGNGSERWSYGRTGGVVGSAAIASGRVV